jgi:hypothetical protein
MVKGMNMYTLFIYIIHGLFGDVMLSHDLWWNVGCNFTYATKTILVVNVGCNYFIVANWHFSSGIAMKKDLTWYVDCVHLLLMHYNKEMAYFISLYLHVVEDVELKRQCYDWCKWGVVACFGS